jgi:hypothetical protein
MITSSFIHPASGSAFNSGRLMERLPGFVKRWKGVGLYYLDGKNAPTSRVLKYRMGAVIALDDEIHILPGYAHWLDLRVGTTG